MFIKKKLIENNKKCSVRNPDTTNQTKMTERNTLLNRVEYKLNGKLHRQDGPAVEYKSGSKEYYSHGMLHRHGGPAIERSNGIKEWYMYGIRYNPNGPALSLPNGTEVYMTSKGVACHKDYYEEERMKRMISFCKSIFINHRMKNL